MRLLVLGATGLVGGRVLELAAAEARVEAVVAPVRRPVQGRPKVEAPAIDFESLPEDAPWWRADAAICALGTTMRKAGSREAFRRVDHGYVLAAARLARRHGTPAFVLNSSMGADPASRFFYLRVKGEIERDLSALGFPSLTLVRPGMIGGSREEVRPAERAAALALGLLGPVLPRRHRLNPAERIAAAMVEAALVARPGTRVVASDELA